MLVTKLSATGAVVYSTYFGGNGFDDGETHSLWVNAAGEAFIGAWTTSTNLPTTGGALVPTFAGGGGDGYIARLAADGKSLLACTYLGGNAGEMIEGFGMDAAGNVVVSGNTSSTNFPVSAGAAQAAPAGNDDGFVAKLTPDLKQLVYGTLIGGAGQDHARAVAVDATGHLVAVGTTASANFPATAGAYQTTATGTMDAFLARW